MFHKIQYKRKEKMWETKSHENYWILWKLFFRVSFPLKLLYLRVYINKSSITKVFTRKMFEIYKRFYVQKCIFNRCYKWIMWFFYCIVLILISAQKSLTFWRKLQYIVNYSVYHLKNKVIIWHLRTFLKTNLWKYLLNI